MRKEKVLIKVLRDIADLLSEESSRNPQFANRLEVILSEVGRQNETSRRTPSTELDDRVLEDRKSVV